MKPKSLVLMVFALGCGLVAMLGVQQAMSNNGNQQVAKTKVLHALSDIPAGVALNETNVEFRELASDNVPEGAITKVEDYEERALMIPVVANDIIIATKLGDKGDFGAAVSIPKGMRVKTIAVTDTKTHSGMLLPADRVDILVTFKTRSQRDGMVTVTKTLIENVEVFAADNRRSMKNDDTQDAKSKTISMLVTPEQAEVLTLAQSKGELDLVLRPKGDHEVVHPDGIDELLLAELKGDSSRERELSSENEEDDPLPNENAGGNIQAFLKGNEPQNTVAAQPVVEEVETWTVKIFAGEDVLEQQFELPTDGEGNETEVKTPVQTSASHQTNPTASQNTVATTTKDQAGQKNTWLDALLNGGEDSDTDSVPGPPELETAVKEVDSLINDDLKMAVPLQ